MLKVEHVEKYYGSKSNVTKALDRISFDVSDGEFIAIMGASGSGKTTLLNCIATIDAVSAGSILLDGVNVTEINEKDLARFRRERLGFVFQEFNLLDTLTIEENISLALTISGANPAKIQERVRQVAVKLGIGEALGKFPYQVSGGQKQRAACARAIVNDQSLILADVVMASIVVVCVVGWLVSYTMRFMLEKRSRELGTYILLGVENRQVAGLFFRENLAVGGVALVAGTLFGNLIFQGMRAIILAMFEVPYTFRFSLSPLALVLTLFYFAIIYLLALRKCRRRIRSMKIGALLSYDRVNETEAVTKGKTRRKMFVLSIVSGVIGTALLASGGGFLLGLIGAILIILSLYSFFVSFSSGVPAFFDKRLALKYTGTNLLVYRTLAAKLTSMGVTMATISLLITATLLTEGSGILFANLSTQRVENTNAFDLIIKNEYGAADLAAYYDIALADAPVSVGHEYVIYASMDDRVTRYIESIVPNFYRNGRQDRVMAASDYAALRSMLGYEPVEIGPGEYLIHCLDYIVAPMENMGVVIERQVPLDYMESYNEPLPLGEQICPDGDWRTVTITA